MKTTEVEKPPSALVDYLPMRNLNVRITESLKGIPQLVDYLPMRNLNYKIIGKFYRELHC